MTLVRKLWRAAKYVVGVIASVSRQAWVAFVAGCLRMTLGPFLHVARLSWPAAIQALSLDGPPLGAAVDQRRAGWNMPRRGSLQVGLGAETVAVAV